MGADNREKKRSNSFILGSMGVGSQEVGASTSVSGEGLKPLE